MIQTGFLRSRPTQDPATCRLLARTGLSPSPGRLPRRFRFADSHDAAVLQPRACRNSPGLGSFPFARHYLGNHCYFLFLRVLRCFSSPGSPPCARIAPSVLGCPIRKSPDQWLFAPPRSLSQLITSFIASESQGIPRTLLSNFLVFSRFFFRRTCVAACPTSCLIFSIISSLILSILSKNSITFSGKSGY